jgi:hypothetical protein
MAEHFEILNYLPIRFKQRDEQEYFESLWDTFESNFSLIK